MLFSIQFITQLTIFAEAMLACSAFGKSSSRCSQPRMRKEWRTLSSHEQKSYLDAIQCLKVAPSKRKGAFNTLQSRYDDFVALHINATRDLSPGYTHCGTVG
ncbi:hypothetical protein FocTR4_00013577 [Fusarium oxysporum f. sp. cubense]|uniref:Uncharacterized protein n=1 Tax=Fusarium oxysporum f. sp. cubense TaxID=61366 RepID=A0A5C6SPJ1_FUSOC|nr:hypothetical protein FocTR4_00013577 [Fusarium oxysporum f. sp. cubense]